MRRFPARERVEAVKALTFEGFFSASGQGSVNIHGVKAAGLPSHIGGEPRGIATGLKGYIDMGSGEGLESRSLNIDMGCGEGLESRSLNIDMGCGTGDFLLNAKGGPALWVGVDIAKERIEKTAVRLRRRGIDNVRLHCGDGQDFLCGLGGGCVSEIHMNFPDPWLKTKQWKNRLFRPSFALDLQHVLKEGGSFFFVTDIRDYAEEVAALLSAIPGWESAYEPAVKENLFGDFPTLFYRRMSPLRPISYLHFRKKPGQIRFFQK